MLAVQLVQIFGCFQTFSIFHSMREFWEIGKNLHYLHSNSAHIFKRSNLYVK